MSPLEAQIYYTFKDKNLLETALIHSSFLNENRNKSKDCYERLEFLGDSVLGLLTAEMLYNTFPGLPEGELTRRRAMLVCEQSLAAAAASIDLGQHMKLGKGEENSGGRYRPSILADVLEALVGAIYLDGGMEAARHFAIVFVFTAVSQVAVTDYKTALQEKVQATNASQLSYRLIEESGPDHAKRFTVEVLFDQTPMGQGTGSSKKEAEQLAAQTALKNI